MDTCRQCGRKMVRGSFYSFDESAPEEKGVCARCITLRNSTISPEGPFTWGNEVYVEELDAVVDVEATFYILQKEPAITGAIFSPLEYPWVVNISIDSVTCNEDRITEQDVSEYRDFIEDTIIDHFDSNESEVAQRAKKIMFSSQR